MQRKIPDGILKNRAYTYLKRHINKHPNDHPIVVPEETYTRISVARKFYPHYKVGSETLVSLLTRRRLLRPKKGKTFSYIREPVDNLSFAECVSMLHNLPLDKILLSEDYFASQEFQKQSPRKRVQTLFKAYNGTKWFEIFKQRLRKHGHANKIFSWHFVNLQDLPYMLGTGDFEQKDKRYNLVKLVDKGLIIPSGEGFVPNKIGNRVDNEALAELVSLSMNRDFEEVYISGKQELTDLVSGYIRNKLIPFFKKSGIDFDVMAPVGDAERLLGFLPGTLYKALGNGRAKNGNRVNGKMAISGVDLAIYCYRFNCRYKHSLEKIAEILGADEISRKLIGFHGEPKTKYHRDQLLPIYDFIAEKARERLYRVAEIVREGKGTTDYERRPQIITEPKPKITLDIDSDETIDVNGDTYILSREGKIAYCEAYELQHFERVSMQHVIDNLKQGHFKGRKIICPQIIFTQRKSDGKIFSARINTYDSPIASESRPMEDSDYDPF